MAATGGSVVLAVDEDPATRKLVRKILESAGLGCVEAADGESGLELAAEVGVSAAIVDLVLPGMSGAELAWRLSEGIPGLPIVAVSGRLDLWDTDDLRDLGVRQVLPKPFEPERLIRAVACLLPHRQAARGGGCPRGGRTPGPRLLVRASASSVEPRRTGTRERAGEQCAGERQPQGVRHGTH